MSEPLELASDVLDLVRDRAGAGVEAEVTVGEGRFALTRFANSSIHQNVADDNRQVHLKVVLDGRQSSATTNRTEGAALLDLVDAALAGARLRPVDPGWPGLAPATLAPELEHYDRDTHLSSPAARAEVVKAFVDAGGTGSQAAGFCDSSGYTSAFANSLGQCLVGRASRAAVEAIHRRDRSGGSGRGWQSSARLSDLDGAAAGSVAEAKATAAGAAPIELEPGPYEVVMEPACVADIVDFLVSYGSNAKSWLEGQSWVRLGEAQLDPSLSIWDDACDPRTTGIPFDAEGTPKVRAELVRAGLSVGLAHDRRTAAANGNGAASTGHAVAGGEHWGAFCTNLFLDAAPGAGRTSVEEMIGSVERGLLVTELWYTRVLDPKTQVVTGLTRNGTFLIEGGRIGPSVGDLRFTQSYVEALAPGNVLGVGDDARLSVAGPHVPSLRLGSWAFTGSAGR